jgi:hypothetical protein
VSKRVSPIAPPPASLDVLDEAAMTAVLTQHDLAAPQKFAAAVTTARAGLQQTDDHKPFEEALVTLGTLAGAADSYTYDDDREQSKPDAV